MLSSFYGWGTGYLVNARDHTSSRKGFQLRGSGPTTVRTASSSIPFFLFISWSPDLSSLKHHWPGSHSRIALVWLCTSLGSFYLFIIIYLEISQNPFQFSPLVMWFNILCFSCVLINFRVASVSLYCNIPCGLALFCLKAFWVNIIYVRGPIIILVTQVQNSAILSHVFSLPIMIPLQLLPCLFLLAFIEPYPLPHASSPVSLFPTSEHSFITCHLSFSPVGYLLL